ncbi:MAG TPA: nitroreductase family protein, partial [Candidatus Cloacimonadota bacterium]|nr:nitroreductase family protein [Candidatus Cloacimonadota bacterium]
MLKDLVCMNRSIRRYDATRSISKEELFELVNLARLSPSAANRQPIKYVIVNEKEELDKVFACIGWAAYLQDW